MACLARGLICVYAPVPEKSTEKSRTTGASNASPDESQVESRRPDVSVTDARGQGQDSRGGGAPLVNSLSTIRRDPFDCQFGDMQPQSHLIYDHFLFFREQAEKLGRHNFVNVQPVYPDGDRMRISASVMIAAGHLKEVTQPGAELLSAVLHHRSSMFKSSQGLDGWFAMMGKTLGRYSLASLMRALFKLDLQLGEMDAVEIHLRSFFKVYDEFEREGEGTVPMPLQLGINQNFFCLGLFWGARGAHAAAAADMKASGLNYSSASGLARSLSTAFCLWNIILSRFMDMTPAGFKKNPTAETLAKWLMPKACTALFRWLLQELKAERAVQIARERELMEKEQEQRRKGEPVPSRTQPPLQGSLYDPKTPEFEWKIAIAFHALGVGARRVTDNDEDELSLFPRPPAVHVPSPSNINTTGTAPAANLPSPENSPPSSPKPAASLPTRPKPTPTTPRERLREFSRWTERMQNEWRKAPKLAEWEGAQEILGRALWLSTDEGMEVLELIATECIPLWMEDVRKAEAGIRREEAES